MSSVLVHSELLGHLVRADPWLEHGVSSYTRAIDALACENYAEAEDYGRITVQEASEAYELFEAWLVEIPGVLKERGVDSALLVSRIGHQDLDAGWETYRTHIDTFAQACRNEAAETAREELEWARSAWQQHHDRACDALFALFDTAAAELGEAFVGELWDVLLGAIYERSARVYHPDNMPWGQAVQRLLLDIIEATRGHLTGPDRDGAFTITEDEDRWVVTFAPCGSGGRSYAATETAVTTQKHDWAWNKKGVCLYCAHCCQLQQRAPIERLGFPLRVIEPPIRGQSRPVCTWSIFKEPGSAPPEAYTDVGFNPPGASA